MPQVDPETGSDHKTDRGWAEDGVETIHDGIAGDFPPESFWLSKDAEYDWFDRNAVYERKESSKGNSSSSNTNPSMNNSSSQRSKSKASMIGLPKTQKTAFAESKWRTCKAVNTRLFPRREKSAVPEAEPGSPKVSCMGRVRSKRSRRRSNSLKSRENPSEKSSAEGEKKRGSGFCCRVTSVFRSRKGHGKPSRSGSGKVVEAPPEEEVEPRRRSVSSKGREIPAGGETAADPPGLGGMVRFSSGRRSGNWAAEEIKQAI